MARREILSSLLILLFSVWSIATQADETKLVLTGSSTIAPLALEMAKRYEKIHPGMRIDVQSGGSSRGVQDARSGLADIGMVSRALNPEETDLQSHLIAMDGITMIVHKTNPIAELTTEQIKAIYTGEIKRWKEVSGNDLPISVVNKAEGRSTLELFLHYFQLENRNIKAQVVIGDNQQGIKTVSANPGALGYVSIGSAEFEAEQGTAIRLLPLKGVAASIENVRNGSFPLSRQLNLVTKGTPSEAAKKFIEFAQSDNAHDLIEAQYFVPVKH